MPRNISLALQTELNKTTGTKPVVVLQADWDLSITSYYSDREFFWQTVFTIPSILNIGSLSDGLSGNSNNLGSVSFLLSDNNNDIRTVMETFNLHKSIFTVYLAYLDQVNVLIDSVVLLKGTISSEPIWDEGNRTFSLTLDTFKETKTIGTKLTEIDYPGIYPPSIDKIVPESFGDIKYLPAIPLYKGYTTTVTSKIDVNSTSFSLSEVGDIPTNTVISLKINELTFLGVLDQNALFNIQQSNTVLKTVSALPGFNPVEEHVAYFEESSNLTNKYLRDIVSGFLNKCINQTGQVCEFEKGFTLGILAGQIFEVSTVPLSSWGNYSSEYEDIIVNNSSTGLITTNVPEDSINNNDFFIPGGSKVTYLPQSQQGDTYVFSKHVQTFRCVHAWRTYKKQRIFSPVPVGYYNYNPSNETLNFPTSLVDYVGEGWEDTVYVSFQSMNSSNIGDILQQLIILYTDLTPDTTSFYSLKSDLVNLPAHFVINTEQDALKLIKDIAYQANVSLIINNNTVYVSWLRKMPVTVLNMTEKNLEFKTLKKGLKPIDSVFTKFEYSYTSDYSGRDFTKRVFRYEKNTSLYGERFKKRSISIFRDEASVKYTSTYWANLESERQTFVSFTSFIESLVLLPRDIILLSIPQANINNQMMVTSLNIDTSFPKIEIKGNIPPVNFWEGDTQYLIPNSAYQPFLGLTCNITDIPKDLPLSNISSSGGKKESKNYFFRVDTDPKQQRNIQNIVNIRLLKNKDTSKGVSQVLVHRTIRVFIKFDSTDPNDKIQGWANNLLETILVRGTLTLPYTVLLGTTEANCTFTVFTKRENAREFFKTGHSGVFQLGSTKDFAYWVKTPPSLMTRNIAYGCTVGGTPGQTFNIRPHSISTGDTLEVVNNPITLDKTGNANFTILARRPPPFLGFSWTVGFLSLDIELIKQDGTTSIVTSPTFSLDKLISSSTQRATNLVHNTNNSYFGDVQRYIGDPNPLLQQNIIIANLDGTMILPPNVLYLDVIIGTSGNYYGTWDYSISTLPVTTTAADTDFLTILNGVNLKKISVSNFNNVGISPGAGIVLNSVDNTIWDVNTDGLTLEIDPNNKVIVKDGGITRHKLNSSVAGAGLALQVGAGLDVQVDGVTTMINASNQLVAIGSNLVAGAGIIPNGTNPNTWDINTDNATVEVVADVLRVKDGGITKHKLDSSVAGAGLTQTPGYPIDVQYDGTTIGVDWLNRLVALNRATPGVGLGINPTTKRWDVLVDNTSIGVDSNNKLTLLGTGPFPGGGAGILYDAPNNNYVANTDNITIQNAPTISLKMAGITGYYVANATLGIDKMDHTMYGNGLRVNGRLEVDLDASQFLPYNNVAGTATVRIGRLGLNNLPLLAHVGLSQVLNGLLNVNTDGTTIGINGSNQLEMLTTPGVGLKINTSNPSIWDLDYDSVSLDIVGNTLRVNPTYNSGGGGGGGGGTPIGGAGIIITPVTNEINVNPNNVNIYVDGTNKVGIKPTSITPTEMNTPTFTTLTVVTEVYMTAGSMIAKTEQVKVLEVVAGSRNYVNIFNTTLC